jgi:hypothetical protein
MIRIIINEYIIRGMAVQFLQNAYVTRPREKIITLLLNIRIASVITDGANAHFLPAIF